MRQLPGARSLDTQPLIMPPPSPTHRQSQAAGRGKTCDMQQSSQGTFPKFAGVCWRAPPGVAENMRANCLITRTFIFFN